VNLAAVIPDIPFPMMTTFAISNIDNQSVSKDGPCHYDFFRRMLKMRFLFGKRIHLQT
jgi:hypothetical protein